MTSPEEYQREFAALSRRFKMLAILFFVLAALFLSSALFGAKAADLGSYKDGGRTAGLGVLLPQGTYASIGIGETFDTAGISSLTLSGQGASGDFRLGYDALLGNSKFVVGPLIGVGVQNVTGKTLTGNEKWNWEIGARAGRIFNSSDLLYVLVAYNQQHEGLTGTGVNPVLEGPKVAGGIEFDVTTGVTIGTELGYTWFNDYSVAGTTLKSSDMSGKVRLGTRF